MINDLQLAMKNAPACEDHSCRSHYLRYYMSKHSLITD